MHQWTHAGKSSAHWLTDWLTIDYPSRTVSYLCLIEQVHEVELLKRSSFRCSVVYPEPSDSFERRLTLATFVGQYILPMTIISAAYGCVSYRLWLRRPLGQSTCHQRLRHVRTRRRTIAMLMIIVAIFNATWLPLNLYHMLTDFHPNNTSFYYNSTVYLCLHWLAISSVCCNPFAYCWLNESFRAILCNGRCAAKLTRSPAILRPLADATDPDRRCIHYDRLGGSSNRDSYYNLYK